MRTAFAPMSPPATFTCTDGNVWFVPDTLTISCKRRRTPAPPRLEPAMAEQSDTSGTTT